MANHRFLCFSDLHGEPPPPADEAGAAAWLVAGDSVRPGEGRRFLNWARQRQAPVFAVAGNHDCGWFDTMLRRHGYDLTGRPKAVQPGLWVLGVGWSGKHPSDLPEEWHLARRCRLAHRIFKQEAGPEDVVVLVTHYPPRLPGLSFAGAYECVGRLVEELRPAAVVFGHDHGRFSEQFPCGRTLLACPGPFGGTLDLNLDTRQASFVPWLPLDRG